jgi:hypothetical protein
MTQTRFLMMILVVGLVSVGTAAQSVPVPKDIPSIAKAANGSIVSIVMSDDKGKPIAQGTGFVVSKDGLLVTNYHVIAEGVSAVAKFPDGAFYLIDGVVASDKSRDVAILKALGHNFRPLSLGNSDRVQVGEEVVAIGSPLSLESTVSNGIVSGMRTAEDLGGKFLQVTAPISPGSSGGPLFNMMGEVIGITTMYIKGGENLNFAIPINDAKRLLLTDSTKLNKLPNEKVPQESSETSGASGNLCRYFLDRITSSLPQVPTLCQDDRLSSGNKAFSIFSPNPVLAGSFRRAWSTALFQTIQAAAIDGPCQAGCLVSISDARMASASVRYETYISKESQAAIKDRLKQLGGFGSDGAYFLEWGQLLSGTKSTYPLGQHNAKYLVSDACKNYLGALGKDPLLSEEFKNHPKEFPSLPTCSVMMTTDFSIYVLVDFPSSFMTVFGNFMDPLADAFHRLSPYDGQIIFRGPWNTYNDGTTGRAYRQYSLRWLAFIHDEVSSGTRTLPESAAVMVDWAEQNGQGSADSLFAKEDKTGAVIVRNAAVYKIVRFQEHSKIQLTDGSEWTVSSDTSSKCGLLVGDEIFLMAQKSAEGTDQTHVAKGPCTLDAAFADAWPASNGPITKNASISPDRQPTWEEYWGDIKYCYQNPTNNLQMQDGTVVGCKLMIAPIEQREQDCKSKNPQNNPSACKSFLKGYKDVKAGRL